MLSDARQRMDTPQLVGGMVTQDSMGRDQPVRDIGFSVVICYIASLSSKSLLSNWINASLSDSSNSEVGG
jgi:hypothetical protein